MAARKKRRCDDVHPPLCCRRRSNSAASILNRVPSITSFKKPAVGNRRSGEGRFPTAQSMSNPQTPSLPQRLGCAHDTHAPIFAAPSMTHAETGTSCKTDLLILILFFGALNLFALGRLPLANPDEDPRTARLRRTVDGFFLKISYLFRL